MKRKILSTIKELLDLCKSVGPDGMHPRILKEVADVAARPCSMILEESQEGGEIPCDRKKGNID